VSGVDVGDLCLRLYDELAGERRHRLNEWFGDPWVQRTRRGVSVQIYGRAKLPEALVNDLRTSSRGKFALALGIDDSLAAASPFTESFDQGPLTALSARYRRFGRFNSDASEGLLLPRCAFPGRPEVIPERFDEYMRKVVRVPPAVADRVIYRPLRTVEDVDGGVRLDWLPVGCAPLIDAIEDLDVQVLDEPRRFRLATEDTNEHRVRMERILRNFDASGVVVGFLPEAALCASLVRHWQELMRQIPRPRGSRLQWVLVGTGPTTEGEPPVNQAVLLNRITAEVLITQDKLHPFTFDAAQLGDWALTPYLGAAPITEDIVESDRLTIVASNLGRIAILICEDLDRAADVAALVAAFNVSHLFSPVFAKELERYRWQQNAADGFTRETGTTTFVNNSLVVPRLQGRVGPARTCLAVWPDDESRNTWGHEVQFGFAEEPTDVFVLFGPSGTSASPLSFNRRRAERRQTVIDLEKMPEVGGDRRIKERRS